MPGSGSGSSIQNKGINNLVKLRGTMQPIQQMGCDKSLGLIH